MWVKDTSRSEGFHFSDSLNKIEPTWGQIEPNIGKFSKLTKTQILIWKEGIFGGYLWSAIVLSSTLAAILVIFGNDWALWVQVQSV